VQVAHSVAVAPTYQVGSFDDDANYLMAAHVLASGGWLTSVMPSGVPVVANYLPGYPVLLVPLVWLFGSALWPPRVLSAVLTVAVYPLLWTWTGRRGLKPGQRAAVLVLLAVNSVVATFSTMVMAEAPFLVVFLLTLFALDRLARSPGPLNATMVLVLLAELVWLKEAAVGLIIGLVGYELWHRRWRWAAAVGVGTAVLPLPGLAARWATGGSTVGDRYASEIANPGEGGLLHQVLLEAPRNARSYLENVLRQSLLPAKMPILSHGPVSVLMTVAGASVPVFVVLGAVLWCRRHASAECWMIGAYFVETLAYPFANQRRVFLVLPVVTIWYVVGAFAAGRWVATLRGRQVTRLAVTIGVGAGVVLAVAPTAVEFTRNYLWATGQRSSEFAGSPAVTLLKSLDDPDDVVETDYRGTIAYFTGHRTAWTAFTATTPYGPFGDQNVGKCTVPIVKHALQTDGARFLVVGDFNGPGFMDSPCLLHLATSSSTAKALDAMRLLSTDHDQTSVFELLGPGSTQPRLTDWSNGLTPLNARGERAGTHTLAINGQGDAGGTGYLSAALRGQAALTWYWRAPVPMIQLSVGSVTSTTTISHVSVSIETPAHTWSVVASAPGCVGDTGVVPYLWARFRSATTVLAVRVSATVRGRISVTYLNVIGPDQKATG
jgi:hypothetical protein